MESDGAHSVSNQNYLKLKKRNGRIDTLISMASQTKVPLNEILRQAL